MISNLTDLLGGASRTRTRPRGFAPNWTPRGDQPELLANAQLVIHEYREHLPLTIRQIFYRLVGTHGFEKTERAYGRLGELLVMARRSRMIPMDAIRDDGGVAEAPLAHNSPGDFFEMVRRFADDYRVDRTAGQPAQLMIACEAAGMVPQLARVADPYGIGVRSSSGFESLTEKHALAAEIARAGRPFDIMHIGDHDPSGVHIPLSFFEDVAAFCVGLGGDMTVSRIAVTPDQITAHDLPTAPPKASDKRAFNGETSQAEALAPDVLAGIVRAAILARLDVAAYDAALAREAAERDEVIARLARATGP